MEEGGNWNIENFHIVFQVEKISIKNILSAFYAYPVLFYNTKDQKRSTPALGVRC